ncbi:MAG: hypothetical protein HZB91_05625 [Elusimicrobia bacterium]|nr:hypothetical protein [Elusimicrobiota bacterium]
MCFSANVSFAASAALIPSGGWCVKAALERGKRRYLPLAVVPVLFGIQQFSEGVVWRALDMGQAGVSLVKAASSAFLFFALWFWPFWMPLVAMMVEQRKGRRVFMGVMMVLGVAAGSLMFGPVAKDTENRLLTRVACNSIAYDYTGPTAFPSATTTMIRTAYLLVAGLPLLLCTDPIVFRFGVMLALSAAGTHYFYTHAFASVWCFFSALMSGYICWSLSDRRWAWPFSFRMPVLRRT